jgi:uncharacterized protein (TIGR03000 family)
MRKCLVLSAIVASATLASPPSARASGYPPYYTSALFSVYSQGWQTNLYWYHWHYPWFAYYNYSHGPYANWMAGGGWATYGGFGGSGAYDVMGGGGSGAGCGPQGCGVAAGGAGWGPYASYTGYLTTAPTPAAATVAITLPPDAKLLFNGHAATGTGETRTFRTPPLQQGMAYTYELTAEVVRDGKVQTVTEKVVVRPGEKTSVTLSPDTGVRAASK